jgi:dGTP triphosphohydrolase
MSLKMRLAKAKEIRQTIREVEEAKWKKEHEAREADIEKQAAKLSQELDVSVETAVRYIKARKVSELRAARTERLRQKAVKVGQTVQKYGERMAVASEAYEKEQHRGKRSGGTGDLGDMFAAFAQPPKHRPKKRKKPKKVQAKHPKRKRPSKRKPQEIRIIVG